MNITYKKLTASPCEEAAEKVRHAHSAEVRTRNDWVEKTCPVCSKIFYPPTDEWAYKRGSELFCSWHCLCAFEKKEHAPLPSRKSSGIEKRNLEVIADHASGMTAADLSRKYSLSRAQIYRIIGEKS